MIKGINRQIIEVCDEKNIYFERMLLFVRPGRALSENELKSEVGRMSGELSRPPVSARELLEKKRLKKRLSLIRSVILCLTGAAGALLLQLIINAV